MTVLKSYLTLTGVRISRKLVQMYKINPIAEVEVRAGNSQINSSDTEKLQKNLLCGKVYGDNTGMSWNELDPITIYCKTPIESANVVTIQIVPKWEEPEIASGILAFDDIKFLQKGNVNSYNINMVL